MIETWLAAGALALLAATFLIAGSRRGRRSPPATDAASAFAARRRELRAEAQAQGLESSTVAALEEELALDEIDHADDAKALVCAAALGESSSPDTTAESLSAPPLLALGLGVLAIALVSLALYALWGEPYASTLAEAKAVLDRASTGDQAPLPELEQALASRTRRKPEDDDGWYFLGHARMRMGNYRGAANAFTELRSLTGANAQVDLALAQAHYMVDGGTMTEATRMLAHRALASNPHHLDLLSCWSPMHCIVPTTSSLPSIWLRQWAKRCPLRAARCCAKRWPWRVRGWIPSAPTSKPPSVPKAHRRRG